MTAFSQLFAFLFRSFRVDGGDSSSTAAGPLCRCVRVHLKNNETHILINSANDNFYLNFIYHKSWAPLPDDIFQNMLMKLIFQFCTFLRACVCVCARLLESSHPTSAPWLPLAGGDIWWLRNGNVVFFSCLLRSGDNWQPNNWVCFYRSTRKNDVYSVGNFKFVAVRATDFDAAIAIHQFSISSHLLCAHGNTDSRKNGNNFQLAWNYKFD